MRWLSSTALRAFRAVVGLLALILAAWLIGRGGRNDAAVRVSLLVFGLFVIAHLLLDLLWAKLWASSAKKQPTSDANADPGKPAPSNQMTADENAEVTKAFRETTGVVISTSGVVLGLVSAFSSQVTLSLKVGIISLVVAILVAIVLYLYILYPLPEGVQPNVLVRYLLTVSFFALAFGLLSIAMSIVFK